MLTVNERVFFPTVDFTGLSPGVGPESVNYCQQHSDYRNVIRGLGEGGTNNLVDAFDAVISHGMDLPSSGLAYFWTPVDRTFHHRLRRFRNVAADLIASLRQSH